jgi:cytochrome c oxidase subunit 3
MNPRPTVDAALLPPTVFGSRAPAWWGNTLLMVIETTSICLLLISYFYLWRNFEMWPPVRGDNLIPGERFPDLFASTIDTALELFSCFVLCRVQTAAYRVEPVPVFRGLLLCLLVGLACIGLRFAEFQHLHCRWDENAYGSIVWALLVVHLTYLIAGVLEMGLLVFWMQLKGFDKKQAFEATLSVFYWYWAVVVWVILYFVIYWLPRLL